MGDAGSELDWEGESIAVPRLFAAPGTSVTLLVPPEAVEARLAPVPVPAGAPVGVIARERHRTAAVCGTSPPRHRERLSARRTQISLRSSCIGVLTVVVAMLP